MLYIVRLVQHSIKQEHKKLWWCEAEFIGKHSVGLSLEQNDEEKQRYSESRKWLVTTVLQSYPIALFVGAEVMVCQKLLFDIMFTKQKEEEKLC